VRRHCRCRRLASAPVPGRQVRSSCRRRACVSFSFSSAAAVAFVIGLAELASRPPGRSHGRQMERDAELAGQKRAGGQCVRLLAACEIADGRMDWIRSPCR
jgi:hypothetical protein